MVPGLELIFVLKRSLLQEKEAGSVFSYFPRLYLITLSQKYPHMYLFNAVYVSLQIILYELKMKLHTFTLKIVPLTTKRCIINLYYCSGYC